MPIGLTPTTAKQFVFKLKVTTGSDVTAFFQDTAGSAVFPRVPLPGEAKFHWSHSSPPPQWVVRVQKFRSSVLRIWSCERFPCLHRAVGHTFIIALHASRPTASISSVLISAFPVHWTPFLPNPLHIFCWASFRVDPRNRLHLAAPRRMQLTHVPRAGNPLDIDRLQIVYLNVSRFGLAVSRGTQVQIRFGTSFFFRNIHTSCDLGPCKYLSEDDSVWNKSNEYIFTTGERC